MQRWFAVLIGVMCAASASASDTVANVLAGALRVGDREHWRISVRPDDSWLRLQSDLQSNPIGEYLGAGVVYRSASTQYSFAIGVAEPAAPFERALGRSGIGVADREAVYEMSWRIELSKGFALQSNVQYIRNPGMDATVDSSWTIGLCFELSAR